jgi:hypothetical protein
MTLQADTNNTPANGAEAIYLLKELLKTAGWTVPRSSDGTTYNAAADEIASAVEMATANAWFVVRCPTWGSRTIEWCFQRGASNTVWRVKVSDSAGFSGGTPGVTRVPSATDEVVLLGSGTDAAPNFSALFGTDGTYRWSILANNASSYEWVAVAWPTGGVSCSALIFQDPVTGAESGDISPVVFSCSSTVVGDPTVASILTSDSPRHYALFNASYVLCPMSSYGVSSGVVTAPAGAGTSPVAASDTLLPVPYMRRSWLGGTTGFKGFSTLFRWNTVSRAVGDAVSVSPSTRNWVQLTNLTVLWDGSVPVV